MPAIRAPWGESSKGSKVVPEPQQGGPPGCDGLPPELFKVIAELERPAAQQNQGR
jgi:hypothetical protein